MTRVLVTGATGRVGSQVAADLGERTATVRVASRRPDEVRDRFGDAEAVEFDLARPETWGAALDGIDRLFLLFPPGTGTGPVREFLDAASRVGVAHVVFLSVLGAEKVPVLPHRRLERHLERGAPTYTFLRAAYFMQNLSEIHRPEIVTRDELFVPAGDGKLGFVDARDVAAVAARALTETGHEDRAYDLTGAAALDFTAVAEIFSAVLDRQITYADPSRLAFAHRMTARGVPLSLVAFMLAEYQVARFGLAARTTADVERVLGRPATSMRTFVADYRERFEPAGTA